VKTKTVCVTAQGTNTKISYWSSIWNESQPIHFIATCGSNDSYLTKKNYLTVKIVDISLSKVII
jgi:hypothetical protein